MLTHHSLQNHFRCDVVRTVLWSHGIVLKSKPDTTSFVDQLMQYVVNELKHQDLPFATKDNSCVQKLPMSCQPDLYLDIHSIHLLAALLLERLQMLEYHVESQQMHPVF